MLCALLSHSCPTAVLAQLFLGSMGGKVEKLLLSEAALPTTLHKASAAAGLQALLHNTANSLSWELSVISA